MSVHPLHPLFQDIFSAALPALPLSMRAPIAPPVCLNCEEPIQHIAWLLPESLGDLFPREKDAAFCSLDCVEEWIGDRVPLIARRARITEVDA